MASIRQRRLEQPQRAPSSQGLYYRSDEEQAQEYTTVYSKQHHDDDSSNQDDLEMGSFDAYYRPQPPIMIPDKKYNDYMLGRSTKRKDQERMCPDSRTCAGRCIGFSWIAIGFLLWAGLLIDTQPIFIKGVLPKDGCLANAGTSCRIPAASRAYQSAFAYFITICLCTLYRQNGCVFIQSWLRRYQRKRTKYQDIPDNMSPRSGGLPTYHSQIPGGNSSLFNRIVMNVRNMMGGGGRSRYSRNKRRSE